MNNVHVVNAGKRMNNVFVVNAGSSSLKYQLIDMESEQVLVSGNCERIGIDGGKITYKYFGTKKVVETDLPNHKAALDRVVDLLLSGETKVIDSIDDIVAVGHRLAFSRVSPCSNEITPEVLKDIEATTEMFPLHLPGMLTGIRACQDTFSGKVQVAVYDNSFHLTMPPKAYMYAIPYDYYKDYGFRRYGYHGTSHRYVSLRLAKLLGKPVEELKIVSCHLGNGSSLCAVDGGKSVDTTMGYTALAGLMMGTRSGDIDPSLLLPMAQKAGLDLEGIHNVINKKSGLLGVSGVSSDHRDVENACAEGDERAQIAIDMLNYQIQKYIGSYAAAMNGLDAVIFTAGIGEHSPDLRREVCRNLDFLGIRLDEEKNAANHGDEEEISTPDSRVKVWVIPTNEELMIARDAYAIYQSKQK